MQILVVVAATQANQFFNMFELVKKTNSNFFCCWNDFFFFEKKKKISDGIIALRAEVEKVSGRAALDSGWAGPKERAKAVCIEKWEASFKKIFESESLNSKKHSK